MEQVLNKQKQMWQYIFSLSESVANPNEPLTARILSDSSNIFVKTLIYIYSMESFVFSEMNRASRMKDLSKIKYYGPFASALGFVIHQGNKKETNLARKFKLYRGLQMSQSEFSTKFKIGSQINLQGFTSTTLDI